MGPSDEEEVIEIHQEELAEFIFEKLVEQGAIVTIDDILRILSIEVDFYDSKGIGIVEFVDED